MAAIEGAGELSTKNTAKAEQRRKSSSRRRRRRRRRSSTEARDVVANSNRTRAKCHLTEKRPEEWQCGPSFPKKQNSATDDQP